MNREESKVVVQISQYVDGKLSKGSKSYTLHSCYAHEIMALLKPLHSKYAKKGTQYIVRIQISEYSKSGERYRKQRGGCITLYDAFINNIFEEVGQLLAGEIHITDRYYEPRIHGGMWCLCCQSVGNSKVLEVASEPTKLLPSANKYKGVTYILNPKGIITPKKEVQNGTAR